MNKTTKTIKKRNTGAKRGRKRTIILGAVLIAGVLTGGLVAKYRSDNQKQAEMIAEQFHVSSDYLEENNPSYDITDWQDGFEIQLYNYEKENTALISEDEIQYKVTLSDTANWTSDPQDETPATIVQSSEDNKKKSATIRITPKSDANVSENDSVKVTVQVQKPFTKTLSATFHMKGKSKPNYSIKDQKDGTVLMTIQSNNYSGNLNIIWTADRYAPDNTNPQMETWQDSDNSQTLSIQKNTTYELLFFKKFTENVNDTSGNGITISLP